MDDGAQETQTGERVPRARQCAEIPAGRARMVRGSPALGWVQRPLRPARRLLSTRIGWFVGSAAMDPGFSPSGEG